MVRQDYKKIIRATVDCSDNDILEIEALMKIHSRTPSEKLVSIAVAALEKLRKEDPAWTLGPFDKDLI